MLPAAVPIQTVDDSDAVADEADRWKRMDKYVIESFTDDDGVINEMALHYKHRSSFPLHYCVFKQVSSHLSHEANTERLFSLAGALSDGNGKMCPDNLATWTSIGANMDIYKPSADLIFKRYFKNLSAGSEEAEA